MLQNIGEVENRSLFGVYYLGRLNHTGAIKVLLFIISLIHKTEGKLCITELPDFF